MPIVIFQTGDYSKSPGSAEFDVDKMTGVVRQQQRGGGGELVQQMPAGDLVMIFQHSQSSVSSVLFRGKCRQQQHQQVSMRHFRLSVLVLSSLSIKEFCEESENI